MGARLSLNNRVANYDEHFEALQCKRQWATSGVCDENPRLIPSLPDEISIQILARLPRVCHFNAKLVSRSWKSALTSVKLYKLRKELGTTEDWLYVLTKTDDRNLAFHALDPVSGVWQRLPPFQNVDKEVGYGKGLFSLWFGYMFGSNFIDSIRGWLGGRDVVDQMPSCGSAIGAVDGSLYVLGGFGRASVLKSVWRYDPIVNSWSEVAPMSRGRAYCKTSVLNDKLYVVGGVTNNRGKLTPLDSVEVFDPRLGMWSEVPSMPFCKTKILPSAFLPDMLKPIATGVTSYRGKLYVPQSLYCWPFFVDAGGEVYDPETNSWTEMPLGMGEAWPTKQAPTKLSVVVDGELYALYSSGSKNTAGIKVYDRQDDAWRILEGEVPIQGPKDSETPYLLADFLGKLHVIVKGSNNEISVLEADRQNRCDSPLAKLSVSLGEIFHAVCEAGTVSSDGIWRVIASRNAGSAELVNCQIIGV